MVSEEGYQRTCKRSRCQELAVQSLPLTAEPCKHGFRCPCWSPGSVTDWWILGQLLTSRHQFLHPENRRVPPDLPPPQGEGSKERMVTKVFYTPLGQLECASLPWTYTIATGGILAFVGICANDLPCPPHFTGRPWNS